MCMLFCIIYVFWPIYNQLTSMQQKVNLFLAMANTIALKLSLKENNINEEFIENDSNPVYYFTFTGLHHHLKIHEHSTSPNQKDQDYRLCDIAIKLIKKGFGLRALCSRRNTLLIQETLRNKEDYQVSEHNLQALDLREKENKNKIKKFILETYRRKPQEAKRLAHSLKISKLEARLWIKQDEKRRKKVLLREQVFRKGLDNKISMSEFKRMAKKIYKSKLFRATDRWCLNFAHKHNLQHVIICNQNRKESSASASQSQAEQQMNNNEQNE